MVMVGSEWDVSEQSVNCGAAHLEKFSRLTYLYGLFQSRAVGRILLQLLVFLACVLGSLKLIHLAVEQRISWWVCVALVVVILTVLLLATPDLVLGTIGSA
jgi:hypothetical protein